MRSMRIVGVVVVAAAMTAAAVGMASADTPAGEADLGMAHFVKSGVTVDVPTLAQCLVDNTVTTSSGPVVEAGVTFGGGSSSCTRTVIDPDNYITSTTSTVRGQDFQLSALVSVGGPRIEIASYQLTCAGAQGNTSANWSFSGMSGLPALPSPVPPNYTESISRPDGLLLANAEFNIIRQPGDGRTSMTMMAITFAPGSGISGSITVGNTACTPTS
jgi:hypothetical protein